MCNSWIPVGGLWYLTPLYGLFGPVQSVAELGQLCRSWSCFQSGLDLAWPALCQQLSSSLLWTEFLDDERLQLSGSSVLSDHLHYLYYYFLCFCNCAKKNCLDKMSFFIVFVFYFNQFCHLLESIFVCVHFTGCVSCLNSDFPLRGIIQFL